MSYMEENTYKAAKRRKHKKRVEFPNMEQFVKGQVIYRKGNALKYVFRVKKELISEYQQKLISNLTL
ncbi:MAG: hypothetical protein H6571_22160 [Lewinellaceae bacterium]|nr:hypothetical protein [Lewinellaceae bacterium]